MHHSKAAVVSVAHLHRPMVHLHLVSVLPHLVLAPPHQVTGLLLNLNLSPVATHQAIKVVLIKEMVDSLKEVQMDTLQVDQVKETKVNFWRFQWSAAQTDFIIYFIRKTISNIVLIAV